MGLIEHYDVAVMGAGGMGSAAIYHLAQRGVSVCGIDRFGLVHDRGSSHGETRIIRKAYLEHPDYVPLLDRAYELWDELEAESEAKLFTRCGLLALGHGESRVIRGQEACYAEHDLPHEVLEEDELRRRYPMLAIGDGWRAYHDPLGGFLGVEDCVRQHLDLAQKRGAVLYAGERVLGWQAEGDSVRIETDKRHIAAGRLVLAAGPWAAPELCSLGIKTQVVRKVLFWYQGEGVEQYSLGKLPCFLVGEDGSPNTFYGFPAFGPWGLKVTEHNVMMHKIVEDPLKINRELEVDDEAPVRRFVDQFFPRLRAQRSRHVVCMYTMTPDEHFVVDKHPECAAVVLAAGFSGHGFKFSSVMGEILADLALEGKTSQPIDFLSLDRFASR
jgi:sarcosine oxidase